MLNQESRNKEIFLSSTRHVSISVKVTTIDPNFFRSSSFFSSSFFSVESDRHIRLRICVFCEILFFFGGEEVGRWTIEIEMLSRLMGD